MTPTVKHAGRALAIAVMMASAATATAQTNPPGHPTERQPMPPQHFIPPDNGSKSPDRSRGQGQGVIQPPDTGDRSVIAPKNQSQVPTPEIKPPGTPGGNPDVQPK